METRAPDYSDQFRCLAGACPHSCCADWEVVLDPVTADLYRALPGSFGDRLRAAMKTGEGETFFTLTGAGRCPFWDGENLCEIHRLLGAARTSEVCRSHPRFVEDYGSLRETSLCASCPEAGRLLLEGEAPLTFPPTPTDEAGESPDGWLAPLLCSRAYALALLQDRRRPLPVRLAEILGFAHDAQALLDEDEAERLPELCRAWTPALPSPAEDGLFPAAWRTLQGLEILGDDWKALLSQAETASPGAAPDWALERITAYFLFRYYLKAINDGDLLSRVKLAVFAALVVERLAQSAGLAEALRLFCREIEHDQDNLDALQGAFRHEAAFALPQFIHSLQV